MVPVSNEMSILHSQVYSELSRIIKKIPIKKYLFYVKIKKHSVLKQNLVNEVIFWTAPKVKS